MMGKVRPTTLTLAALGGQGGGVVSDWLIEAARHAGFVAQATSVPGVAQRTGATIYYLEFFPKSALPTSDAQPIMALMPSPGDVDIVVASELMEAARAIARGIVTPDRTVLISSTHRDYTIREKSALGDGRADPEEILKIARGESKRLVLLDMNRIAEQSGSRISAVILGALAGSGALPLPLASLRAAIEASGIAVSANLAGFDAAVAAVHNPPPATAVEPHPGSAAVASLPAGIRERVASMPSGVQALASLGVARLIDYQDVPYAQQYLDALEGIVGLDKLHGNDFGVSRHIARGLALWMSFEDVFRVADLKTRADRAPAIRVEVGAKVQELVYISEFVKPRVEEICGTMPAGIGQWMLHSPRMRGWLGRFTHGRRINTGHVGGFLLLRVLAGLRHLRRHTYRYTVESARIDSWLANAKRLMSTDYMLSVELAACQRLVKGYGDTHERGWKTFSAVSQAALGLDGNPGSAEVIRKMREDALAQE
jgi:indolepyruvate ferredoxin oxidoreductase beta subunit